MDLEIMIKKKKRIVDDQPKIRWGSLTLSSTQEMGDKLMAMGAWESRGDTSSMWDRTDSCIREAARDVLGVSRGRRGGQRGDWWWNGEVQGKVEAKKVAYAKLVDSKDDEEKLTNRERYKIAGKEAKLAVSAAKRSIKVEEVKGAVRRMHRGRATGPDEIPGEFWKSTGRADGEDALGMEVEYDGSFVQEQR
ncbi:uncharacterized protein LOC132053855 [Lycium ferocissimum]|uniref:uncharacterized protein LOC132053855 n=1 Tax=Lycium ferocissimum TaxID=112874 RepID=UPI0028161643|nr:uncharacterized protein LOC132053855 [Lycium ferocissimum]